MAAPLVIVLLVAMSDAQNPATLVMASTAEAALGDETTILVRSLDTPIADVDAQHLQVVLHADALVEVQWLGTVSPYARVHLHLANAATWSDREVSFVASDPPEEQGRTIGLAIATMIPRPKPNPATTTAPSSLPFRDQSKVVDAPSFPQPSTEPRRFGELDALAIASRGVGGYAGGMGGELAIRIRLTDAFSFRVAAGARLGEIPPGTTATAYRFGAGIAWRFWTGPGARPAFAGLHADALLLRHVLARPTPDDREVSRDAHWLSGMDMLLEGGWAFESDAAFIAGAGVEVAFQTAHVLNAGQPIATIPRLRLVAEVGLRARF